MIGTSNCKLEYLIW